MAEITPDQRAGLRSLSQALNVDQLARQSRVRVYRNGICIAMAILILAIIAIPIIAQYFPTDLASLRAAPTAQPIPLPKSAQSIPPPKSMSLDLLAVELWGMVGGLVSVLVALRRVHSSRQAINLQYYQLWLKIPAGSIVAVFGIVLPQADIVPPLKPVTTPQLTAYAVLFGFAQEALTSLVDRQANRVLMDNAKAPGGTNSRN